MRESAVWLLALTLLSLLAVREVSGRPHAVRGTNVQAVQDLINRRLPTWTHSAFVLEIIPPDNGTTDVFEIDETNISHPATASVVLRGTNGVSLASALNWYLKYLCNVVVVDWVGAELSQLSSPLPIVEEKIRIVSPHRLRYYLNTCTHSYSTAYWDWNRWEREIDWMALNGVNMPLAFTGQEQVFLETLMALGVPKEEALNFFTGPPFLAWNRMGNIQEFAGPLGTHWISAQAEMQKEILKRQEAFGMMPVLPAFAGHVPESLVRLYPQSNFTKSPQWAGFDTTYSSVFLLDPNDELFAKLQKTYLTIQKAMFNPSTHYYNIDLYNEMVPSSNDSSYLRSSSAGVLQTLREVDPNAVWVIQGWLFSFDASFWKPTQIEAYLSGVPNDGMVILDLNAYADPQWKRTNSFYGKPFVWCTIHNGGGRRAIYGNMTRVTTGPIEDMHDATTMVGVGLAMEAIEQNPIFYELAVEMNWRDRAVNLGEWVQRYHARRYGEDIHAVDRRIDSAWSSLLAGAYSSFDEPYSQMVSSPSFNARPSYGSNATAIQAAWVQLVAYMNSPNAYLGELFLYDVVDVTRQVLANLFIDVQQLFASAFDSSDSAGLKSLQHAMMQLLVRSDELLGSNENFLVGTWLAGAQAWANSSDPSEVGAYNYAARNQITLWGPDGELSDYASKPWSGCIRDYHRVRWQLFTDTAIRCAEEGRSWNWTTFNPVLLEKDKQWNFANNSYPTEVEGVTADIVNKIVGEIYNAETYLSQYTVLNNTDASGYDLLPKGDHAWSTDPVQLAALCSWTPSCVGFNSNGYFKSKVESNLYLVEGSFLYVLNASRDANVGRR